MPDGIPFHNEDGLWSFGDWETGTHTGPRRNQTEIRERADAIRALTANVDTVVYALELPDRIIKIGCTKNLVNRRRDFVGSTILAFRPGTFEDEKAIHVDLRRHRARGREYYRRAPDVLAVVNEMRDHFNLPHIAA